jgi:putative DNA primase/helicase
MTATVHPLPPPRERPTIRTDDQLHAQGDQAVRALSADPDLYQQGGYLVHVVRVDPSSATPARPEGTPEIRRVEVETLREELSRYASWERRGSKGEYVECHPPKDVAAAVRKRGQWFGIRPLEAITEAPALRPDGSILDRPGYDAATRVLYLPSQTFPGVRERPSRDNARRALSALLEPFAEIPFEREEQRHVPIAALLTLLARPAIRGAVPAFGFNSPVAGAGKSLCVQVISAIATGRWSEPSTYPADPVELEKSLGGEALAGSPIVDFDNVEDVIESGPLLKAITARDKVRFRVLGANQKISAKWRAVVLLGGIGLCIGRQMSRRILMATITPREERPELRTGFKIPDLAGWALAERGRLLAAGLTVLRGYTVALQDGAPRGQALSLGGFEEWSSLVSAAMVWAGGPDVALCRAAAGPGGEDPETTALRVLLGLWGPFAGQGGQTARGGLELLYPRGRKVAPEEGLADGWGPLRGAIEDLCPTRGPMPPTPDQLGKAFRKVRGRWIGGKRLVNREDTDGKSPAKWAVESAT